MGDGERRGHRYANVQQRDTRGSGDGKDQRQHQHETDFIEQGETDGETGQYNGPLNMFFTEFINQGSGDTLRAAAVRQHFTEHSAEAHDQCEAAERAPDAVFDGYDDFIQRHTLH